MQLQGSNGYLLPRNKIWQLTPGAYGRIEIGGGWLALNHGKLLTGNTSSTFLPCQVMVGRVGVVNQDFRDNAAPSLLTY